MSTSASEKRTLPRLLCRDHFSNCAITINKETVDCTPVNFHREGMAIFTPDPLAESDQGCLSFTYDNRLQIASIVVQIIHVHEIDVGCQYGLWFNPSELAPETALQLANIELELTQTNNTADRYGLFS